ncbi:hypothetical protein Tco_0827967 [Tanacetum coccineum]
MSLVTSSWMALFRSGACPLLFCLMGGHPSRIFKQCSAMDLGTPASAYRDGLFWVLEVDCYLYPFRHCWLIRKFGASVTILNSAGIMMLLRSVTIPPSTRNLSIPWVVDGTA